MILYSQTTSCPGSKMNGKMMWKMISFGDYLKWWKITCHGPSGDRRSERKFSTCLGAPKALPRFPREKMKIWNGTQGYFNKLVGEVTHTTPAHLKSFRQTHLVWLGLKRSKCLLILSRFQVSPERRTKNSKSCFNHQPKVQNKTKKHILPNETCQLCWNLLIVQWT